MKTDTLWAYEIENNDQIVVDGEHVGYVYGVDDHGDGFVFDVVNDDAEHNPYHFGPFDPVTIVVSFDDDEVDPDPVDC